MRAWMKTSRKEMGLTQEELASRAKCSRPLITDIENGNATPSIKMAKAIATALGVPWVAFFSDDVEAERSAQ